MADGSIIQFHGLDGYLAPAQKAVGGVILLPMIYGLNKCVRDLANRLADHALTTLVWNPYPGRPVVSREDGRKLAQNLNDKTMLAQLSAWLTYMHEDRKLAHIATIGFCLGGRVGLLHAATDRRVAGHVCYYPTIDSPKAPNQELDAVKLAGDIHQPVLLVHPGKDHHTGPDIYAKLNQVLHARHGTSTVVASYPDADHGFIELGEHPGQANVTATHLSWPLAITFLRACVSS